MISDTLLALARCPRCLLASAGAGEPTPLRRDGACLACPACGTTYPVGDGFLDLRPPGGIDGRETHYAAEAETFAGALDYRAVGEPLLGAAVRERWLRRWLPLSPGRLVLDLGAGDGRFALWNRNTGAQIVALDAAPFFADAAIERIDLALGDVRALPFPAASFDAAYSIDVMEHLDAPGLERFFAEAARVLKPGGLFYLYSNTRERATLWPIVALWGWLSRLLRRRAIGDFRTDDLRKGDHVKVLTTWPQVAAFAAHHGLRVEQVRFWNGVFQGLIDNVLIRVGEGVMMRRGGPPPPPNPGGSLREWGEASDSSLPPVVAEHSTDRPAPGGSPQHWGAGGGQSRLSPRQAVSRRPAIRVILRVLTWLMQLDIILFGRLRSGPFFALLRKGGV